MNLVRLESLVSEKHGQLVNCGQKGLLVLDNSGSNIVHFFHTDLADESYVFDTIQTFFSEADSLVTGTTGGDAVKKIVQISADIAILADVREREHFLVALKTLLVNNIVLCRFYFESKAIQWQELLQPLLKICDKDIKENRIVFQLYGSFEKIDDSTKDFLFINQFRLYCVVDSVVCSNTLRNTIADIAEYGFRVPCVWYVDEKSTGQILDVVDEIMNLNLHSGFALPLSSENFFKKKYL
jgi:hypothetical protein